MFHIPWLKNAENIWDAVIQNLEVCGLNRSNSSYLFVFYSSIVDLGQKCEVQNWSIFIFDSKLEDGAPKIAFSCLLYAAKNGRCHYSYWELLGFANQQTYLGGAILW